MTGLRPLYQPGQCVRVVPGDRNNIPRRGTVRMVVWHHKDGCYDYYLRACGKLLSKRYRAEDLEPDAADPAWLTTTVAALVHGIRADAGFDRLSILADALQDANCDDEVLLGHCRGPSQHVRGCWVVELLTGLGQSWAGSGSGGGP